MEDLEKIVLSGTEYPYKCDNYVLSKVQKEYETLGKFEMLLTGKKEKAGKKKEYDLVEPDLDACNKFLYWCICEGLDIEADLSNKEAKIPREKTIVRKIDVNPYELSLKLTQEFYRGLHIKK